MKHLFVMLAAAVSITMSAAAQVPPTLFDREKNTPNSSSFVDSSITNVRILPNPGAGTIILMVDGRNANGFTEGEAIIYSNGGYPVAKRPFATGTNNIYVNNLTSGLYFMRLVAKTGQTVVKEFVVTR